jgi:hypothetical protein
LNNNITYLANTNKGLSKGNFPTKTIQLKSDNIGADQRVAKRQKPEPKDHTSRSPIVSLEIDDGEDETLASSSNYHRKKCEHNDFPRNEANDCEHRRRQHSPKKSNDNDKEALAFGSSNNESQKNSERPAKKINSAEVECIEIDLSDDSSTDELDGKNNPVNFEIGGNSNESSTHTETTHSEKMQSSTSDKKSEHRSYEDAINGTQRMKHLDVDDGSASKSSDSSVSLEVMPPPMTEYSTNTSLKGKNECTGGATKDTVRLSFNNDYDNSDFIDSDHDRDVEYSCRWSDCSDNNSHNHRKEEEQTANRKASPYLKDDVQVLEVDSDDSDNSSTDDDIFTSRPFKAKMAKHLAVETEGINLKMDMKCPTPLSELATPRAFSPTTTSPTLGAYTAKRKVPTPAIPAMSASLVKEIGGKLYPDLRHNFILTLTGHARRLRHNAYQRAAFEAALRAIVVIR